MKLADKGKIYNARVKAYVQYPHLECAPLPSTPEIARDILIVICCRAVRRRWELYEIRRPGAGVECLGEKGIPSRPYIFLIDLCIIFIFGVR